MVTHQFKSLINIKGEPGKDGVQGPAGTFAAAYAHTLPASEEATVSMGGTETAKTVDFGIPRGLPGVNALANDAAVAAYVAATDTDTRSALEDVFTAKDTFFFNAADHGVVGDGVTDDTTSMQALLDAVPDGSTITAPPGAVYRSAGWVVPPGKSLHLDFKDATLLKITDAPIVKAEGVWDVEQSVGGVDTNMARSTVTVTDGSVFSPGDIVKVVADEAFLPSVSEKRLGSPGEFAIVTSVDGNAVDVSPRFYDEYTTNIRIFRAQPYKFTLNFKNADWGPGGGNVEWNQPMFQCVSMIGSEITGHVTRAPSTVFEMRGCLEPTVRGSVDYAPGATGYLIADHNSTGGQYYILSRECRHAFTDSGSSNEYNDDPSRYGRSMRASIYGASNGGTGAVFDTHSSGFGHSFHNIKVAGSGTSTGAVSGAGFSIRGIGHTYYNCEVHNALTGFQIHDQTRGEPVRVMPSTGHRFVNCKTSGVRTPFKVVKNDLEPTSVYDMDTLTIEGGVYEFGNDHIEVTNASVRFVDPTLIYTGKGLPGGFGAFFHFQQKAEIYGSLTLLARQVEEGSFGRIIRFANYAPGSGQYVDLDLFVQPSGWLRNNVASFVEFNDTVVGQVRGRFTGGMPSMASWSNAMKPPNQQSAIVRMERVNHMLNGTSWFEQTVSEGDNIVSHAGDDHVTIRLKGSTAVTAGRISDGVFPGQRLTLMMYALATGSVTIGNGSAAYNTRIGSDVTLNPGDVLPLLWDASLLTWVRAA